MVFGEVSGEDAQRCKELWPESLEDWRKIQDMAQTYKIMRERIEVILKSCLNLSRTGGQPAPDC